MTAFAIGDQEVARGERRCVELPVGRLFTQSLLSMPVIVVNGAKDGPHLWLSAAIHGDELNGTEIIRRVLTRVNPKRLRGTVLAVPVVNVFGFMNQSRYLPDRRDLNRSFPGSERGSMAGRLAHIFVSEIVDRCSHGIDLHTGSNSRINLPQIRADLDDAEVSRCAAAFGVSILLHGATLHGTLRETARKRGKTVLVYEAGEPLRIDERSVRMGVRGVMRVMQCLGMIPAPKRASPPSGIEIRSTHWLRAPRAGLTRLEIELGERVAAGDHLATTYDAIGTEVGRVRARKPGIVIGQTTNPLVYRGEAIVHIAELP